MRVTSWLLGLALGILAGGFTLEAGTLVLVLVAPALVWAARERARPLGLSGFLVGAGVGMAGLLAWADARCAADPTCTIGTDPTPFFVFAGGLIVAGIALALIARRPSRDKAIDTT